MKLVSYNGRSKIVAGLLITSSLFGCAIDATSRKQRHIKHNGLNGTNSSCLVEPFSFIDKIPDPDQPDLPPHVSRINISEKITLQWTAECKTENTTTSCIISYKIHNNSSQVIFLLDVFTDNATKSDTNINVQFPIKASTVELIRGYVLPPAKLSWLTAPLARPVAIGQSVSGIAKVADIQREWHYDLGVSRFREPKVPDTLRLFIGYMLAQQLPSGEAVFDKVSGAYEIPRWRQSRSQQWLCSPLLSIAELRAP